MRSASAALTFAPLAVLAAVALAPTDARATALALPAAEAAGPPTTLAALAKLSVDAHLTPHGAAVTERRSYTLAGPYPGAPAKLTFYYTMPDQPSAGDVRVVINGQIATGRTLPPAEADDVRRRLTIAIGDPAPLRDLGAALFVTDPLEVTVPTVPTVDVEVTAHGPLAAHGTMHGLVLPIDWARPAVGKVDVMVAAQTIAPLRAIFSPYHQLSVVRDGVGGARASYSGSNVCTDFDLTLLLSWGDGLVHLDMLPFRYGEAEGGTFLALLTPDPTPVVDAVLPRDIVLVLDTSGSMAGNKIAQAKEALRGVLGGLRAIDSFALVTFATTVTSFQSAAMVKATPDNVAAATAFVDGLQATGGTNIYDALATAFTSLPGEAKHPRYIVLLTDGQPTAGMTGVDAIASMAQARSEIRTRLFSFGIGNNVNTVLLDRLARDSTGDVIYIRPEQSVAEAVQTFFAQIADPVLADPTLDLTPFAAADVFPDVLPDLFAGRTVTLLGRYQRPGRATLSLAGSRGGQPWSAGFDVTLPEYAAGAGYVPRIWALRQVGRLLAAVKAGNTDPALVEEAVAIATRFGVTTTFTYFAADMAGDVTLRYAPVPTAATGAAAVDTSAALRDYGSGSSVQTSPSTPTVSVRYVADRSLPVQGGYLTDTKLAGGDARYVDLTFGSERYFAFAAAEARFGAGALLSVGRNARFELLGRAFRVTAPTAPASSATEIPPESPAVPLPAWQPTGGNTTSVPATTSATLPPVNPARPGPIADQPAAGLADRNGCACASAPAQRHAGDPFAALAVLVAAFVLSARRPDRRARSTAARSGAAADRAVDDGVNAQHCS
jgi:Ca-activated chloride channel family protein